MRGRADGPLDRLDGSGCGRLAGESWREPRPGLRDGDHGVGPGERSDRVVHIAHLADLQSTFQACLQDAGAAPARAAELAAMLMLVNEGIRVSSRRRLPDAQHLQPIAATFRLVRLAIA